MMPLEGSFDGSSFKTDFKLKQEQAFAQWLSEAFKFCFKFLYYAHVHTISYLHIDIMHHRKRVQHVIAVLACASCKIISRIVCVCGGGVKKCTLWLSFAQQNNVI
jgi:hypothetical protein